MPTTKNNPFAAFDAYMNGGTAPAETTPPDTPKRNATVAQFVSENFDLATRVGAKIGVDPAILLGQWGLETGWGKSVIPSTNNLSNIKDTSGAGPQATDNQTGSRDAYRQYDSPDAFGDSFSDLIGRRYAGAVGSQSDAGNYFRSLKAGGYAEDPAYVGKGMQATALARQALGNVVSSDKAQPANPFAAFDAYMKNLDAPIAPPKSTGGEFSKGFGRAFAEVPGLLAGVGAYAADAVGAQSARDSMLGYAKERQDKVEKQYGSDAASFSNVIDGKAGFGDFVTNAAGYVVGQALQSLITGGIGAIGAKMLAKQGIVAAGEKIAAETLASGLTKGLTQDLATTAAHDAAKSFLASEAKRIGLRGATIGAGTQNLGMELGSIYPDAVEQSIKDGGTANDVGLARVGGAALAAAAVDTAMDRFNFGKMVGGSKTGAKPSTLLGSELAARAAKEIPAGMAREAGTEGVQTGLERFGANKDLTSPEAYREYVDSMAVGSVGGGLAGGMASRKSAANEVTTQPAPQTTQVDPLTIALQEQADKGGVLSKAVLATITQQASDLNLTQPGDDLAAQRAGYEDGLAFMNQAPEGPVSNLADKPAPNLDAANTAGQQWQDIKPIGTPEFASSEIQVASAQDPLQTQPNPAASAGAIPLAQNLESTDGQTTQAAQALAPEAKAATQPVDPVARTQITAPAALVRAGVGIPTKKERLAELATQGFDVVERRPDGFWLFNAATNEEMRLNGGGDAQLARVAISNYVKQQADTAAASPNNDRTLPTPAQIASGNYKKSDVILINGMRVVLENPAGSTRSGVSPEGKAWKTNMVHHYGEFIGTEGADGDRVDAFIGPRPDSNKVFVIDQVKPDGSFDEHKVILGAVSPEDARNIYLSNYEKNWTGLGAMTEMTVDGFKAWAKSPKAKKPASSQVSEFPGAGLTKDATTGGRTKVSAPVVAASPLSPANPGNDKIRTRRSALSKMVSNGFTHIESDAMGQRLVNPATDQWHPLNSPLDVTLAKQAGANHASDNRAVSKLQADAGAVASLRTDPRHQADQIQLADANSDQTKALDALLDIMAKLTGHRGIAVQWRGKGAADGAFTPASGRYVVNVDRPVQHVAQTIAHEFKHLTEQYPGLAKLYDRMWDLIPQPVRQDYFSNYLFSKEVAQGLTYRDATPAQLDKLKSELLADFMGQRFNDRAWLEKLSQQKPALFGEFVRDWLKVLSQLIGELKALIGKGNFSKDLDRQMRDYQAQLEQAKDIAMEVATVWAQKNPKLAQSTGAGSVIQHAKRAGPTELKFQHNYIVPEIDGAFDDGSGAIAYLPAIKFQSSGFQREYPAMPVRIRVGEHQRDKTGDFVKQYGLQHRIENTKENAKDRGYASPEVGDEVERAARDITLGVLDSQTAYADSSPTKVYLHATTLNRSTVLEVQTDSEGQKFWSVVTSMPSTREQMLRRYKAPTSVVGTTLNGERTQQAFDIKRGILDKLKEPGQSPVTSESYIIDEDGLLFKQSAAYRPTEDGTVASQPPKAAPKVLARDANGRIILNKNKTQLSGRIGETEESNLDHVPGEVQLSWEAKPGASTGLMPRMAVNGGAGAQRVYLMAMKNALSVYGPERMLWDKGRYKELVGGGGLKGITGYAVQSTLQLPDGKLDDRTRAEVDFFLATRGMWLAQEGMAWHAPIFGQNGLGLEINLGGKQLSHAEFEELYAAVRHELNDYSVPPIPSKDGIRFLNFTGIEQAEFINKITKALNDTSIGNIWSEANENTTDTSGTGRETGENAGFGSPLRPGSSDLQRGSEHDGHAFTPEGIRTFDFDGDLIENDWRLGEGQYRERAIKAWELLKDLPDQSLPKTLDELNVYLADTQKRVDAVNAKYATEYDWQHANLTSQQRATGIGASFGYPASQIDTPRAAKAYFKNPDGTLETLYHGTASIIKDVQGGVGPATKTGAVFYASSTPLYAEERAMSAANYKGKGRQKDVGANIAPVNILASNPFDWRILEHRNKLLEHAKTPRGYTEDSLADLLTDGDWRVMELKELIKGMRDAGFDSFLISDDPSQPGNIGVGIFNPEDVVFAIGLNGQKLATPETQLSARVEEAPSGKRDFVGRTGRTYTPEQLKAFSNVGFEVEIPTLKERAQALWKDAGKKLAQGIVDQFMPIKELSKEAYGLLRLSKGSAGSFETLLKGGKLKLTDGVYDFDETQKGGVIDKLLIPMQGEHHDFLRWVAANRAESLLSEDKERLFTQDDIDAIKTLADGTLPFDYQLQHGAKAGETTRNRSEMYADSLITFNAFNANVMDMAEQSGLIDGEARKMWESEFYVPFYRVTEESGIAGASTKGGSVRKQAFKSLKGGTDKLSADLLDSTLMNWAHLLDASAKNRAAKASLEAAETAGVAIGTTEEAARQIGKSIGSKNNVVWVMDEGVKHFYLVNDPYVLTAISSLEYAGLSGPIMTALSAAKHALTVGVTASPFFKIRNLIRDSIQVIGTSEISYNPAKNLKDGWKLTNPENDIFFRLLAGGGTIHFGTMLEGSEAKRVQALVESGVDATTILGDEHKIKAFYRQYMEPAITAYNELGNRGEAINRAALYDQLTKQGLSHADASLQARDLMDFSMQGSFATVRFLAQVVPFLNSRLVGSYKLGRSAKENPKRFTYVTGAVAMASLALLAAYGDDDDFKKREDWDRNNFYWFKFGGTAFRIPKPFELGAIGTLAERSAELLFNDEMTGKRFRSQVLSILGDNLSLNPVPQLVKPLLDVYANLDSFSGRPIETMGMERLQSEYRFNGDTSMTARAASTAMNAVTDIVGKEALSPVQVDSLIRGYFGWLGMLAAGIADIVARPATDQPDRPRSDLWKMATGGMIRDLDGAPSRYVSHVYDQARVIEQAYGTWRTLQKQGKVEEAMEFRAANDHEIKAYRNVEAIKGAIAKINQRIRVVESGAMDPDSKRAEINRLNARKDQFARRLAA